MLTPPTTAALSPVPEPASSGECEKMIQNIMDMGYDRPQVLIIELFFLYDIIYIYTLTYTHTHSHIL